MHSAAPQPVRDGQACLEAALLYAARGWSPIPLCPPDHLGVGREHGRSCKSHGKAPLVPWKEWQDRVAPESEIRLWWRHWPTANVGLAMGPGGLVGIDTDGMRGEEALAQLVSKDWGHMVQTLIFRTPGGGLRRLYVCSGEVILTPRFHHLAGHEEVRILGKGSQTVVPPSRHQNGGLYQWSVTTAP